MQEVQQRRTVNIALIGSGFIGKEHAKAYSLAPVSCPDIAATPVKKILCDTVPDKVAERAKPSFISIPPELRRSVSPPGWRNSAVFTSILSISSK